MKKFLIVLMFIPALAFTQSEDKTNSLWNKWLDESLSDTIRCNSIHLYGYRKFLKTNPDSAIYYFQIAADFAKQKSLPKQLGQILHSHGTALMNLQRYEESFDYLKEASKLFEEVGFHIGQARVNIKISDVYKNMFEYNNAISYLGKNVDLYNEMGDKKMVTFYKFRIASLFFNLGNSYESLKLYQECLNILGDISDTAGIVKSLINIGITYQRLGDNEKALEFLNKSIEVESTLSPDKQSNATTIWNNIGIIYHDNGDLEKAMEYYSKGLSEAEKSKNKSLQATLLNNIGEAYSEQGEYTKAMDYYQRSLSLRDPSNNIRMSRIFLSIGSVHFMQKEYNEALKFQQRALNLATTAGALPEIKAASYELWMTYKKLGRFEESLKNYEQFKTIEDSINNEEAKKEIIKQQFKIEYEKQATADSIKAAEAKKTANAQIQAQKAQLNQEKTQRYALIGGLGLLAIFGGVSYNRFRLTRKQRDIIDEQKSIVTAAHELLTQKNQEIIDSIEYAKRIQTAILPPPRIVQEHLKDSFILYKPKDVVAGDFYWLEVKGDWVFFAAADCTGHGVPGAMVSVICNSGLNRSIREFDLNDPGKILDKTRSLVIQEFEKSEEEVKDGMDISLCALNRKTKKLLWAGANNPLWIIRNQSDQIEEIKADKQPIGQYARSTSFTNHHVQLHEGDTIYVFSDGFADQFGGEQGKKYKSGRFKKTLIELSKQPIEKQKQLLNKEFEEWKGPLEQLDDVCVIGVQV